MSAMSHAGSTYRSPQGRAAVSHIVGRDPETLDEHGVSRAAIESAAENFSDGVVGPIIWFAVLGLPGLFFCKAVNTLDSMIGHHDSTYEHFGKFAARLDDAVMAVPARIAGLLIVITAAIGIGTRGGEAWSAVIDDAEKHRSVNAGWPEAAMAGALGLALAGPRHYRDFIVDDAWMNENGRADATAEDIGRALSLYRKAGAGLAAMLLNGSWRSPEPELCFPLARNRTGPLPLPATRKDDPPEKLGGGREGLRA